MGWSARNTALAAAIATIRQAAAAVNRPTMISGAVLWPAVR